MFHDAAMSAEQQMLRKVVSQLAKDFPNAYFLGKTRANQFPQEFWRALADNGFLGLEADGAFGGSGMNLADLLVLLYGLAAGGMVSYQLLGQLLASHALTSHGSGDQQKEHLPGIIAGKRWAAAMLEDVTGNDAYACSTAARASGDGYVLAGRKYCVAGAGEAEFLLVTARVSAAIKDAPQAGLGVFIVPANAQGLVIDERELGVRVAEQREARMITGDVFADVTLQEVALPRAALLGTTDGAVATDLLAKSLLMLAAASVGWGDRVIDQAVAYAMQRVLYTEPIAAYQAIQHPMVRAKTEVEMAKLLVERAVHGFAETKGLADRLSYAAIAKQAATEAAFSACDIAIQSHGGSGFDREVGIITLWPLVLMARMMSMNSDVILAGFGGELLKTTAGTGPSLFAEMMK
jgi:acyl-CoA dehydrogenase